MRLYSQSLIPWHYIREDTQIALLCGCLIGIMLAIVLSFFPGEPFDYKEIDHDAAQSQPKLILNEKKLDEKSRQAEIVLGIPSDLFKNAIVQATQEHNQQSLPSQNDSASSTTPFSLLAFLLALFAIAYFYAVPNNKQFSAPGWLLALAHLFPREAQTLGFSYAST